MKKMIAGICLAAGAVLTFTVWCCMKVGSESERAMERAAAGKKEDDWVVKEDPNFVLDESEDLYDQSEELLSKAKRKLVEAEIYMKESEQFEKKAGEALEENEQLMEQSDVLFNKYLEEAGYEGDCKDEQ